MDRTWISKIGYHQIVSKTVGLQLKAIRQTRQLWNKNLWLYKEQAPYWFYVGDRIYKKLVIIRHLPQRDQKW